MTTAQQMRSRMTKKGQITVPSKLRKRFQIEAGKSVEFEETGRGILLRPVHDLIDSAGSLSKYATAEEVLRDLLESRKKPFW